MSRRRLWRGAAVSLVLLVAMPATPTLAGATTPACTDTSVPVALAEGAPADQTVAVTLCEPTTWASEPKTVDVLVAGATYNRSYWDWPENPQRYSYVDKTLVAGRATLNFDRLGSGASSKPHTAALSITTQAFVLHQLVHWARERGFERINGIGHSLGSVTLTKTAATWPDFDNVVVTGIIHLPGIGSNALGFVTALQPATLDPKFWGTRRDPGYLTTIPGHRNVFYSVDTTDPAVIARDEADKDLFTTTELAQAMLELETPAPLNSTRSITAPVLVVMGADDAIFCSLLVSCATAESILANEAAYYSGSRDVHAVSVSDTAHNLTLHPSADASFRAIDNWLQKRH